MSDNDEYLSNLSRATASNRAIQPGPAKDPRDHEAYGGHNDGHSLPRAGEKYPNKIKGMTDEEVDANEARRPKDSNNDAGEQ